MKCKMKKKNIRILFCRGLEKNQEALLTHGDVVTKISENFKSVGQTGSNIVAIANDKMGIYGLQFHPEVKEQGLLDEKDASKDEKKGNANFHTPRERTLAMSVLLG